MNDQHETTAADGGLVFAAADDPEVPAQPWPSSAALESSDEDRAQK